VVFPDPEQVRLDRDLDQYIFFGYGAHRCLGLDVFKVSLPTMLRTLGRLENLRRAPGPQGQLKKIDFMGGITMYMDAKQSSFSPWPMTMKIQWDGDLPQADSKAEPK
jgi:cytochrome P450